LGKHKGVFVTEEAENLVECPNCEGEGFFTAAGVSAPCGECAGEGEIPKSKADMIAQQGPMKPTSRPPKPPWEP